MAAADSRRAPDARSPNGTPLFRSLCPHCGAVRLLDRRKIGRRCRACAMASLATHGLSSHPLYWLLKQMQARCECPSASNYAYYGGRGIKVCDEWRNNPGAFVAWAEQNGYVSGLEIDRIDPDGDYEPGNCRFVTHADNSRARRNSRCDKDRAQTVREAIAAGASVSAAAKKAGVPYMTAWHISKGATWR